MSKIVRYNHGYLSTSPTAVVRADRGPIRIESIWVCNTSGSNDTFSLYHVPSDESQTDEHALFKDSVVRSKVTEIIDTPIRLSAGESIWAEATSANAVVMTIYEAED